MITRKHPSLLAYAAIIMLTGMLNALPALAKGEDAAIANITSAFDTMIEAMLDSSAKRQITVAITYPDQKEDDRKQVNVATACFELLASRISLHKNITLVDQETVNTILERLQLYPTGIYETPKLGTFGRLVDADYIITLASAQETSQNDIKMKCIEVAGDRVISQNMLSIPRRVLEKSAQNYLIDNRSYSYKPFPVRLIFYIPWLQYLKTDMRTFESGISAGVSYDLKVRHSFILNVNYFADFDRWYVYQDQNVQDTVGNDYRVYSAINLNSSFESTIGYGYIIKAMSILYIRPRINLGILYKEYDYEHSYQSRPEGMPAAYAFIDRDTETFTSYVVQPLVDFLFFYNARVSYSLSVGYDYVVTPFTDSWAYTLEGSGNYETNLSGVLLSGGVIVYF